MKTFVVCTSIFSNSENFSCSLESCSWTKLWTVKVITVREDVVVRNSIFSNYENFSCSLESCSRTEPRTVKVITVREVVRGLHFKSFECVSSKSNYCHHTSQSLSRSVKWTTDHQCGCDFFLLLFIAWIFLQYQKPHQTIQNTLDSSISSLFLSVNYTRISSTSTPST